MRALLGFYLTFGIVFLLAGFYATGECPVKNMDVISNVVFVLGWPVYLYNDVVHGPQTAAQWVHHQACGEGIGGFRGALMR